MRTMDVVDSMTRTEQTLSSQFSWAVNFSVYTNNGVWYIHELQWFYHWSCKITLCGQNDTKILHCDNEGVRQVAKWNELCIDIIVFNFVYNFPSLIVYHICLWIYACPCMSMMSDKLWHGNIAQSWVMQIGHVGTCPIL